MFRKLKTELHHSLLPLIGEIRGDFLYLLKQEIELAKAELLEHLKEAMVVLICWAAAAIFVIFGSILIGLSVLYFLRYLFPTFPLWTIYGTIGLISFVAALSFYSIGHFKVQRIDFYPLRTVDSLVKNFRAVLGALK